MPGADHAPEPSDPQGEPVPTGHAGQGTDPTQRPSTTIGVAEAAPTLDTRLGGALPCVTCGYNLQSISILGVCPECGTAVRATILAVVDPLASELQPIRRPWLVATGLLLWPLAALGAAMLGAGVVGSLVIRTWQDLPAAQTASDVTRWMMAVLVWVSGGAILLFCRPHDGVSRVDTRRAAAGALLTGVLGGVVLVIAEMGLVGRAGATFTTGELWDPPERAVYRLIAAGLVVAVLFCVRPIARTLVARSLAIRTGRVDRQTLEAMAGASLVIAAGDLLGLLATALGRPWSEPLWTMGAALMLLGGLLFTIGLVSTVVDCVRIARSIIAPGPSLSQVLTPQGGQDRSGSGGAG